ncbi:hypothetical protein [Teredinibacter turnerae]|uniref:hypothetical protein n=1 Tax=Teredinibacter turnerae TaxID=2426 RepID=UPI00037C1E39|nr:hypothetical protein [Teredinibacter turnerae]
MSAVTREELLLRLFGSDAYMNAFADYYIRGLEVAINAFSVFEDLLQNNASCAIPNMQVEQWRERVIPNFKGMQQNAREAKDNLLRGKTSTMRSAAGNLRGISKDMDGIGWDWWREIDSSYWKQYVEYSNIAEQMGSNIYYTLSNYWHSGEVIKESITGPVSEAELRAQLKPGETYPI